MPHGVKPQVALLPESLPAEVAEMRAVGGVDGAVGGQGRRLAEILPANLRKKPQINLCINDKWKVQG